MYILRFGFWIIISINKAFILKSRLNWKIEIGWIDHAPEFLYSLYINKGIDDCKPFSTIPVPYNYFIFISARGSVSAESLK